MGLVRIEGSPRNVSSREHTAIDPRGKAAAKACAAVRWRALTAQKLRHPPRPSQPGQPRLGQPRPWSPWLQQWRRAPHSHPISLGGGARGWSRLFVLIRLQGGASCFGRAVRALSRIRPMVRARVHDSAQGSLTMWIDARNCHISHEEGSERERERDTKRKRVALRGPKRSVPLPAGRSTVVFVAARERLRAIACNVLELRSASLLPAPSSSSIAWRNGRRGFIGLETPDWAAHAGW